MGKSMVSCKFSLKPIHWTGGRGRELGLRTRNMPRHLASKPRSFQHTLKYTFQGSAFEQPCFKLPCFAIDNLCAIHLNLDQYQKFYLSIYLSINLSIHLSSSIYWLLYKYDVETGKKIPFRRSPRSFVSTDPYWACWALPPAVPAACARPGPRAFRSCRPWRCPPRLGLRHGAGACPFPGAIGKPR